MSNRTNHSPEVRARAWKTRREKYGPKGHASSYSRWPQPTHCADCARMRDWLVALHVDGVLSEGQAARATGLDRLSVREIADEIGLAENTAVYLRNKRSPTLFRDGMETKGEGT